MKILNIVSILMLLASPAGAWQLVGSGITSSTDICDGTITCWKADSTSVEVPSVTATLSEGAEIVSGHDGNCVETVNDSSGLASFAIANADFNESAGTVDVWAKNNSTSGSTTQRSIFNVAGQTGTLRISMTHSKITLVHGSTTYNLDTVTNYTIGQWRHIVVEWNQTANTYSISVNDGEYSVSGILLDDLSGEANTAIVAGLSGSNGNTSVDLLKVF